MGLQSGRGQQDATLYSLSGSIDRVDYYDTEHYRVMHDFLANPKRMLDILLDAGDEPED